MRRISASLGLAALLVLVPVAAYADDFSDPGFDDPDMSADMGIPAGFIVLFVLVLAGGIAVSFYRVSSARRMATRAGLDPDDAARVTMLSEDGYGATYLASQLRSGEPTAPAPRTTAARLQELEALRRDRLVTDDEYAARRTAILGDL